jgi:hypothetical protein
VLSHITYSLDIRAVLALWNCIPGTTRLNLAWDVRPTNSTFRISNLHLLANIDSHLVPNICHDALKTSKTLLPFPNPSLSNVLCSAQWMREAGTPQSVQLKGHGLIITVPFPVGLRNFSLPHSFQTSSKAYPVSFSIGKNDGDLSQEKKRPGPKCDHSPSSSGDFKNKRNHASAPPYAFMSCTETNLHLSLDRRI